MIKNLKNLSRFQSLFKPSATQQFGAGVKPYDWRDDPKYNPDIYIDKDYPKDPSKYTVPYSAEAPAWQYSTPANYDPSDLTQNFHPELKTIEEYNPGTPAPYWNEEGEVNHEAEYESEDCDFQAEDFKMQHFRKKGPIFGWAFIGGIAFVYIWADFFLQKFPDEDHWRVA